MTRTGKIARLPNDIRDQLNRRLRDGEPIKTILDWLNAIPKVCSVLEADFDGHPVIPSNITEWKKGGYRDWLIGQETLNLLRNLDDELCLGNPEFGSACLAKFARWAALHYASAAQALLGGERQPRARWARLREVCSDLVRLRRSDLLSERLLLDRARLDLARSNAVFLKDQEFWEWTERPDIRQKLFPGKRPGLTPETRRIIEEELCLTGGDLSDVGRLMRERRLAQEAEAAAAAKNQPPEDYAI